MSWDRVGLVSGDPEQPVRRIHFAVDPTLAVIEEARALGADLLVTHHPLLLRGRAQRRHHHGQGRRGDQPGRRGRRAVRRTHQRRRRHAGRLRRPGRGLRAVRHHPADRAGRRRRRPGGRPRRAGDAPRLRRAAGRRAAPGRRSASGSADPRRPSSGGWPWSAAPGDDQFDAVRASGCDVYVTADLRHHPALEAREEARGGTPYLIDAGHWASEWLWLESARDRLWHELGERATRLEPHISSLRTDPWDFLVGARQTLVPGGTS